MRRSTLVAVFSLLVFGVLCWVNYSAIKGIQDIGVYQRIGADAHRLADVPAATLESEYPPLASALFAALSLPSLHMAFPAAWLAFLFLVVAGVSLYARFFLDEIDQYSFTVGVILCSLFLGSELVFARFDILVAALLFLAWRTRRKGRLKQCGFFLALAICLKVVPLLVLPLFFCSLKRDQWRDVCAGGLIGLTCGILLPEFILGAQLFFSNVHYFVAYQGGRGVQIESVLSSAGLLVRAITGSKATIATDHLAHHNADFGALAVFLSTAMVLAGVGALASTALRQRGKVAFAPYFFATLLWILAAGPVLSDQYFVWVLPLIGAWFIRRLLTGDLPDVRLYPLLVATVALALVNQWVFPFHYGGLVNQETLPVIMENIRNVLLLGAVALFTLEAVTSPSRRLRPLSPETMNISLDTIIFIVALAMLAFVRAEAAGLTTESYIPAVINGTLAIVLLWYGLCVVRYFYAGNRHYWLAVACMFGVILRALYVLATPYDLRAHDTGAHVDYIRFVAAHFRIPAAVDGWEFHQAPLYYFLSGAWMKAGQLLHLPDQFILRQIEWSSFCLSLVALLSGVWAGSLLFRTKAQRLQAVLFGFIVASFTSLVFVSSRISNDSLYQTLSFLYFACLLRFWQTGSRRLWYGITVLMALLLLTKISGILFVPIAFACLLLSRKISWNEKWKRSLVSCLLLLVVAGWYPAVRLTEANTARTLTIGNEGMSSGLKLDNGWKNFVLFNPAKVLAIPYNDPWNDQGRRRRFWEYFFRSAFFGEFGFPPFVRPISVSLLALGMILGLFTLVGLIKSLWSDAYKTLPLWLTALVLMAATLAYRLRFPYAPNQDFRFSVVLLLPLSYFLLHGMQQLHGRFRLVGLTLVALFIAASAAFLLAISVIPG